MKTVENQKIIIVSKVESNKEHPYSIINIEASKKALLQLDGNTFKIWYYMAANQDKYTFALSRKAICSETGISESTYHRCIAKLQNAGYLIPKNEKNNTNVYIFYEGSRPDLIPLDEKDIKINIPKEKQKQIEEFHF